MPRGDLEWSLAPGQTLKQKASDPDVTVDATLTVEEQRVVVDLGISTAPGSSGWAPGGSDLALLLAVPVGVLSVLRRRKVTSALGLAMVGVLVAGCAGVGIDGSVHAQLAFNQLQFMGVKAPTDKPQWHLNDGSGTVHIDMTDKVTVTDKNGKDSTESERCVIDATITSIGSLYLDGIVKPPKG